ncbi:MAG TPA: HDOD domain-containing protein [Acidimicrobiales bacterium]|nr:HDOD domain-containing protein [Acidimicrobiales bacterium]
MVSVLFVDDDAACLRAMRDAYGNEPHGWDTQFVHGAGAALDAMAERPVDAVVTSARLTGIGAASLLRLTKQQHPRTARIALSSPGDRSAMLRALPVANQCLSRACGPEVLTKVVERTTRLQGKLYSEATQRLAGEVGVLPSLPSSLVALDAALSNEDCSLAQIAEIMSADVAMVAKVLQLVNSSFFGLRTEIRDLRQAVAYLGIETLRDFALAGAVFRAFRPSPLLPDEWLNTFNAHALSVADTATRLVRTSLAQCEASVAGMLHGIGELVVAERAPAKLLDIALEVSAGARCDEAEARHIGTTYPVIGGYLLSQWGMGYHIVEAITCQRDVWAGPAHDPDLSDVVRVADLVVGSEAGPSPDRELAELAEIDLAGPRPADWVCLASQSDDLEDSYLESVGLLGAVRVLSGGLVPRR